MGSLEQNNKGKKKWRKKKGKWRTGRALEVHPVRDRKRAAC